jgi:ACS family sodium-dependent inorganic phosphate cotransporter
MLFTGSFMIFMLRSNFSIIIIAMKDTYRWSNYEQNLLLGAYFCGYVGPNLIAGMLAERFGGKILIFLVFLLSSIVTALSPLTASSNFYYLFAARLVLGICGVSLSAFTISFLCDVAQLSM